MQFALMRRLAEFRPININPNELPVFLLYDYTKNGTLTERYPKQIRSDNGPEFIARHTAQSARAHGIDWKFIHPGKPNQKGYCQGPIFRTIVK